uniref:Doublesex2 n=1 Tax=Ceriodaphnia dubia TaxID=117530 RepID=I7HEG9_9CRUS|nr:doublesex2 [Ceriodaphnia dubia]
MPFNNEESFEMLSPSSLNQFDHSETIDVEHMDEDEPKGSPTSFGGAKGTSCRNPTCALCKNHGINSALKGHKRYCPFGRCGCDLCRVTRKKQKINASQVASRRAQQQDRELGIERPTMQASTSSGSSTPRTYGSSSSPTDLGRHSTRSALDVERPLIEPTSSQSVSTHYPPIGPEVYGNNIYLESFLLGRNASLLVNALRESRFSMDDLAYLDNEVCTAVRIIRNEVSTQLTDISKYLLDRLQREQINNGTKSSVPYVGNQLAAMSEQNNRASEEAFNAAQTYGHLSRDTVICPPRILQLPSMYNPYVNQ